jgi:hypothetical protein
LILFQHRSGVNNFSIIFIVSIFFIILSTNKNPANLNYHAHPAHLSHPDKLACTWLSYEKLPYPFVITNLCSPEMVARLNDQNPTEFFGCKINTSSLQ